MFLVTNKTQSGLLFGVHIRASAIVFGLILASVLAISLNTFAAESILTGTIVEFEGKGVTIGQATIDFAIKNVGKKSGKMPSCQKDQSTVFVGVIRAYAEVPADLSSIAVGANIEIKGTTDDSATYQCVITVGVKGYVRVVGGASSPPSPPSGKAAKSIALSVVGDGVKINGQDVPRGRKIVWDTLGQQATIQLTRRESEVQLDVQCQEILLHFVNWSIPQKLLSDLVRTWEKTYSDVFFIVFIAGLLEEDLCRDHQSANSLGNLDVGSVAKPERYEIPLAVLDVELQQGVLKTNVNHVGVHVNVKTPNALISSLQINEFGVGYDSQRDLSQVAVNYMSVTVWPGNSPTAGAPATVVNMGEQIEVSRNGIGPIGSTSPPTSTPPASPPAPGSSLADFDTNKNCSLEDTEFFNVVDLWLSENISDSLFFSVLDAWIGQTRVCTVGISALRSNEIVRISVVQSKSGMMQFSTPYGNDGILQLEVFDSNGYRIHHQRASGMRLRWNPHLIGRKDIPNGVYLCKVLLRDNTKEVIQTEFRKIAILR